MFTDRLYTGQRYIADLGIYHYNARFYSPKLGRFLSADTLISGFANPQNLNRFSYVANNPLRYTDPTGHMMTEYDGSAAGCWSTCTPISTSPVIYSPKPNSPSHDDSGNPDGEGSEQQNGFADLFPGAVADSWEGSPQLVPADINELLSEVRDDVHQTPAILLLIKAYRYDTPFYNLNGRLYGTACLGKLCYDRSEINYLGQGELWAALGFTRDRGYDIVSSWKETMYGHPPSEGALEWFDYGYYHYQELYPPGPPPTYYPSPYFNIPWIEGES